MKIPVVFAASGMKFQTKKEMINIKTSFYYRFLAVALIFLFVIQGSSLLISQTRENIERQIEKAKKELQENKLDDSFKRLLRLVGFIEKQENTLKGKFYVLLGICYEKKHIKKEAKNLYKKAQHFLDDQVMEFIGDLAEGLVIFKKRFIKKVITKEKKIPPKPGGKISPLLIIAGVAVVAGLVLLLTKKKPEPEPPISQPPEFVTSTDSLNVPEGGTAAFEVRLSAQPSSDVSVSVTRVSGDTDITVQSGSSLTLTTTNWNQNQTVTLAASEDQDTSSDTATIRLSASGISNKDITATEQDNDVLRFETNTDSVIIKEGRTATFEVRLSNQPSSDIQATVSRVSGDTDIFIQSGGNPTFTTSNWNAYQTVTLRAAEDSDTTDGQAIFRISADNMEDKDVTAIEDDNDSDCNVSITSPSNDETVSGTVNIRAGVSGDCNINQIEFYINDSLLDTDSTSPYTADWDTTTEFDGPYNIRVDAIGPGGKIDSHQITVYVSNQ